MSRSDTNTHILLFACKIYMHCKMYKNVVKKRQQTEKINALILGRLCVVVNSVRWMEYELVWYNGISCPTFAHSAHYINDKYSNLCTLWTSEIRCVGNSCFTLSVSSFFLVPFRFVRFHFVSVFHSFFHSFSISFMVLMCVWHIFMCRPMRK